MTEVQVKGYGWAPRAGSIDILHGPNRKGDVPHSLASVDKAKELMGYSPTHEFKQGLKEAVKWYW